jgi:hypothetical protein
MSERRALSKNFKERRMMGGVYLIRNTQNGRYLLGHAVDLASARNRFQFAVTTGSTVDPRVRADWTALGPHAFAFEVLEELEQGPDQTRAQFDADLVALAELRRAELDAAQAY